MSQQQEINSDKLFDRLMFVVRYNSNRYRIPMSVDKTEFQTMYSAIDSKLLKDYKDDIKTHSPVKWAGYFASYLHKDKIIKFENKSRMDEEEFDKLKHSVNADIALGFALLTCEIGYYHRVTKQPQIRKVIDLRPVAMNHIRVLFFRTMRHTVTPDNPKIINPNQKALREEFANDEMAMTLIFEMFMEGRYEPPKYIKVEVHENI